jgi:hypothetical protein
MAAKIGAVDQLIISEPHAAPIVGLRRAGT